MPELEAAISDVKTAAQNETVTVVKEVIAEAENRIEEAEATALAIADAALQSELGRRIETIKGDNEKCHSELQSLQQTVTELSAKMTDLQTTLAASLTLQAAQTVPREPTISLIPAASEIKEAVETVTTALPEALSVKSVVENPAAPTPKTRKLFL